ncbi:endolytic transglycosylase MltG [Candidatus Saccharibacteria bacterium]|nr:endolytic transglycosylase MltG [Candidatus Saccharibacteria bacterium]
MRVLGLDVGEKRIGVAKADSNTRIAVPVKFLNVDGSEWQEIARLARLNSTNFFVLGLPRSNEGNETAQSVYVRNFAKTLGEKIPEARIKFQDESFTSVEAEERLRMRKRSYEKGEIDAEAAAIILQDFLENFTIGDMVQETIPKNGSKATTGTTDTVKVAVNEARDNVTNLTKKEADKVKLNTKKAKSKIKTLMNFVVLPVFILIILGGVGGFFWAKSMLEPVDTKCAETSSCEEVEFVVSEGESKSIIASNLEQANLIKNSLVFKAYVQVFRSDVNFKSGIYLFNKGMSADEIIDGLANGVNDENTFTFTILPGETIFDVKKKLLALNYLEEDIDAALIANYDFDFLNGRPSGATIEGFLYGETHEFFKDATVKDILQKYLEGMNEVITQNDLKAKYEARGLSLFEGVTLASVVQKEASSSEQPTVAQVFLSRLSLGIPLGSDVTVSYALDVVDPDRQTYSDNQAALTIDSCYNTRLHGGLPCGPISNPGLSALLAVAEPTDTSYLYFLTGDDGLMYYSYTESEHNQNIYSHCQRLCNASL